MKRYRSATVILVAMLAGCGPEGPPEYYRDLLQARSEIVDSLTFVVDEASAKDFEQAEKRYKGRMQDLTEKMQAYKVKMSIDANFMKLRREGDVRKRIDEDILAAMIEGVQAYAEFTKNITYTNVRLSRELKRLNLVLEASVAKKIDEQLNENAPVIQAGQGDFPKLKNVIDSMSSSQGFDQLKFIPPTMSLEDLQKIEFKVDLKEVLAFKNDLDIKLPDLEAPPLPERPAWIDDAYRRLLDRNRNLPVLGGAAAPPFSVRYTDQINLTNTSGQNLIDVDATLMYEVAGQRSTQRVAEANWPPGQKKDLPLPSGEATKVRLDGTAKVGANRVRFAVGLPNAPKKKDD